jgi:RNA polymerase sigma factor (sigma-70 family)
MLTTNAAEDAYIRYRDNVYGFLLRRTGSPLDADELTQQVFADATSAFSRGEPPRSMLAWLLAVAERRRIDELRRRRRAAEVAASLVPLRDEHAMDLPGIAMDALRALTPSQRRIVVLRFVADRPFREIAREVGCNEAACKMRLARALHRLRNELRVAS